MERSQLRRASSVLGIAAGCGLLVWLRVPFCPLASLLGIPCPGCGLTRATLALLRGQLGAAYALHPLVFVLSPLFIASVSSAALNYVRGPRSGQRSNPWLASRSASVLATALLVLTLGVWGVRFLGYLGGPAPVQTLRQWQTQASAARGR